MSDTVPYPNPSLSDQAQELEQAQKYEQAAELYKQIYTAQPGNNYAASRYMYCLRKLNKAEEAVDFGWSLSKGLRGNEYVHKAWAWSLYDYYFKPSEHKDDDIAEEAVEQSEDDRFQRSEDDRFQRSEDDRFQRMQKAADYVLRHPSTDMLIRRKFILAICREAGKRGKWQIVLNFAHQIKAEAWERQPTQWSRMSEYEIWLYRVIKALFETGQYDECLAVARQGVESYPQNKHFRWWSALSKAGKKQLEEALAELQELDKRYQEWFIRRDIAAICEQLQRYEEAWIWYCKAASLQGPLQGRYRMIGQMAQPLQQFERWQEAYEHLQLACLLAEQKHWESKARAGFKQQMTQLYQKRTREIEPQEYTSQNFYQLQRKLQKLWNSEVSATLPHRQGYIKTINAEKKFGFIKSDTDDFHFKFHHLPKNLRPAVNMEVEFDVEESFDHKKQKNSYQAINIHPV
jgi:cold shock CspA family protein